MQPETRRRPGAGVPGAIQTATSMQQVEHHSTARLGRFSVTAAYIAGRDRVLGGQLHLHREPEVAAALLTEELGPMGARAWVLRVLAEVDGGGPR
jgi:hypothetical protein